MTLTGPSPTIQRDRWGRPLIRPRPGDKPVAYTRATTIAGTLDDQQGLTRWKQRMTALGIAQRHDLLTAVAATEPDDKRRLDGIVEQAVEAAGASTQATVGTALHAFVERIDRGMDLGPIPLEYAPDITAYQRVADQTGWKVHAVEQFVVHHGYRIAGTADRLLEIDGKSYIADVKTGSIDYPHKFAVQLAIYAWSMPYDIEAETTRAWSHEPDKDRGLIIWLPAGQGRCELRWVDLQAGREALHLAMAVRDWRKRRDLLAAFDEPGFDPLIGEIRNAATVDDLELVWYNHRTTWGQRHTDAAAIRKAELSTLG